MAGAPQGIVNALAVRLRSLDENPVTGRSPHIIGKIVFYEGAAGSDCSSFRNKLLGHMLLTAVMSASKGIFIQGLLGG